MTERTPPNTSNVDHRTVAGFGAEWTRFDQAEVPSAELREMFEQYFAVFDWSRVPPDAVGFDAGCGSGRWARLVAPRVRTLHCVDASAEALAVAERRLAEHSNCRFHLASLAAMPIDDNSMDFGYCLGVLHHLPDPMAGLMACTRKLKRGAPLLVYLYYAFDNRPTWFRTLWRISDAGRRLLSALPEPLRFVASQVIAALVYFPLARLARAAKHIGVNVDSWPLSAYRHRSFYSMRTDALDRFGTALERRYRRSELITMLRAAGLTDIRVSDEVPYWCAVGYRA